MGAITASPRRFPTINPHPVPDPPLNAEPISQPVETAALRFLFQKEARLNRSGSDFVDDVPITGYEGLIHGGLFNNVPARSLDFNGTASLNAFMQRFFQGICNGQDGFCDNVKMFNQFLHEFDTGSGPMIGRTFEVSASAALGASVAQLFDDVETQAGVANSGLTVSVTTALGRRGFWYDLSTVPARYREEAGNAALTRGQLLGLLQGQDDRMTVTAVPLGSERRFAHPAGAPANLTGDRPERVELLSMVPNTAYRQVPELTLLWDTGNDLAGGTDNHTSRLYQKGLLAYSGGYGLCAPRHEAPRRFRVAGENIRHGAMLRLFVHDDENAGPPDVTLRPTDLNQVSLLRIDLPLHPTEGVTEDGRRIWETSAELEPMLVYRLLAGRPDQAQFPGVMVGLTDRDFEFVISEDFSALPAPAFDPDAWNRHWARVANTDGSFGDSGWVPLSIASGPDCP